MIEDEESELKESSLDGMQAQSMQSLGSRLAGTFQEYKDARKETENEWLKDLRQYQGVYEPDVLARLAQSSGSRSKVFVGLTRTKVMAAYSRIIDLLFQHGDIFILEACIFGSGAVKAGTIRIDKKQSYSQQLDPETGEQAYALSIVESVMPDVESVSIFDLYPDPYCATLNDCDGLFRRHVLTRRQFRDLSDLPQFDSDMVKHILKTNRAGNHTEEDHEKTRRRIAGMNDQNGESSRFVVMEYWGTIDGYALEEHGIEMPEDTDLSDDYSACVWFCDSKILKVMLNPIAGYKIPYHIFPYERSPHQFWGTGVPRMMRDSQSTMNAATRIWLDNLALSSGPMCEVNTDLLAAGEDPTDIHPWRVFLREGGDGSMPAVRWYQPVANANGLNQIVEIFRRFADETTSLPSYTHGEQTQGLNKTATGMSMLMGAANVALKSTIKNIDDFLIEPMITGLFHFNMEFGINEKSKGDLRIVARGSTALVQKEVQSQRLLQFLSLVSNEQDAGYVDRLGLLRDIAKSMDIDPEDVIKTEEQLALEQQQIQQQQQQLLQAQAQQGAISGSPQTQGNAGMGAGGAII
mgnify:CR=1 FL=1